MPLEVSEFRRNVGTRVMKVTGYTDRELSELNSMDYREMKETIVASLDSRNKGIGSQWCCGYGVYSAWIREKDVYLEIGTSCD